MTDCSELFSTPTLQPNFQFCVNLAPASVATHMFLLGSPLLGCFGGVLEQIFFWLDFPRTGKSKFDIRKMSNLSVESSLYNWCFHWSDIYFVKMIILSVLLKLKTLCKINTFEINCLVSIVLSSDLCQKAKKKSWKSLQNCGHCPVVTFAVISAGLWFPPLVSVVTSQSGKKQQKRPLPWTCKATQSK